MAAIIADGPQSPMPASCLAADTWLAPLFKTSAHTYTWLDMALAAMIRGDWSRFNYRLTRGAALVARAERLNAWPTSADIDAAATAFRYERELLTIDETEEWLARSGLTMELWTDILIRDLLRAGDVEVAIDTVAVASEEALVRAEGICSGLFLRFTEQLAARAALADALDEPVEPDAVQAIVDSVHQAWPAWLDGIAAERLEARLRRLAAVDAGFQAVAARMADDEAMAARVDRSRLEWMRIDLERLSFATADAAAEAALCVREDGMTLSDVAMEAGQPIEDVRAVLEDLEEPLRDVVLSGGVDTLVGPVDLGGRLTVAMVLCKIPPSLDDPLIRSRAERAIVESLGQKAIFSHVTWLEKPAH